MSDETPREKRLFANATTKQPLTVSAVVHQTVPTASSCLFEAWFYRGSANEADIRIQVRYRKTKGGKVLLLIGLYYR